MFRRLLEGKTIIITGTAGGIGHKMVERFATHGANVFALARTMKESHILFCKELEEKFETKIFPVYFDLTDYDAMKEAYKKIKDENLPVDGLVNNAGILPVSAFMQMTSLNSLRNTMEANFTASFAFTKYVVKLMMKNGKGSIVNIASIAGLDASEGDCAYGASKAALINMTKCIAKEMGVFGIRANAICPGLTETAMILLLKKNTYDIEMGATPLGRVAQPENIADAAVFLLSDLSSYVTGQVIRVDGGVTSRVKQI